MLKRFSTVFLCCSLLMVSQASYADNDCENTAEQSARTGLGCSKASLRSLVWVGAKVAGGSLLTAVGSVCALGGVICSYVNIKKCCGDVLEDGFYSFVGLVGVCVGGIGIAEGVGVVERGLKDFSQGLKDAMQADQKKKSADGTSLREQQEAFSHS